MDINKLVDELEYKLEFTSDDEYVDTDEHFEDFYVTLEDAALDMGSDEGKVVKRCKGNLRSAWDKIF